MKKQILATLLACLAGSSALAVEVNLEKISKPVRKFIEASPDVT